MTGNKASFFPAFKDVYPLVCYLSLHYGGDTLLLELSVFRLYSIPEPIIKVDDGAEAFTGIGEDYRGF